MLFLFWEINYAEDSTFVFVHGLSDSKAEIADGSSLSSKGVVSVGVTGGGCWDGINDTGGGCGAAGGGGGGGGKEPSCIDKKYFVAACLSCSLSSAVWRLKHKIVDDKMCYFCIFV